MKLTKSLFMLCAAGLSLCACNSDEKELFPEGEGIVEVQIVPPTVATRATIGSMTGNNEAALTVTGVYTVTLTANKGGGSQTWEQGDPNVKFTGVIGPKKVTVTVNGGLVSQTTSLSDLNTEDTKNATKVPAYGETTSFSLNDNLYTAQVTMAIPVARLEFGSISFSGTEFQKLQVVGVYLDNLRTIGGSYSADGFSANTTPQIKDYYFKDGSDNVYGEDDDNSTRAEDAKELPYVLGDAVTVNLKNASATGIYAYNFYGATTTDDVTVIDPATYKDNPQFKICFSEAQLNSESNSITRYAKITKYKKGDKYIALENGKIYQVTAAAILDKNIVDAEDDETIEYELEVEVTEAKWQVVPVTGEWAE